MNLISGNASETEIKCHYRIFNLTQHGTEEYSKPCAYEQLQEVGTIEVVCDSEEPGHNRPRMLGAIRVDDYVILV